MAVQNVTQTQAPWSAQAPYLTSGFAQAKGLLGKGGPQYYPNSTVAPFGADTNQALNMFRQTAQNGSQIPGAATDQLASTLQGDYLNSNPYLDAMYNSAASRVTENYQEGVAPSIGAQFDSAGRYGSGMYQNAMEGSQQQLGDSLSQLAANLYGGSYESERGRQIQAAGMAPSVAPLGYYDAAQMLNVGEMTDAKSQQQLSDQVNRYQFNQERPYDALGRYMGLIQGNYGGQSTQPYFTNNTAQNLGLGLAGIGVADSILGGTKYGGVGGLLGSFF